MDTKKAEAGIRDPRNLLQLVLKDQVGQQDLRATQSSSGDTVPHELVKEDLAGRGSRERAPLHIHISLPSDLVEVSLLKTVQGWQRCRKSQPGPCLLACNPLAGSTVLRPPPVATKQALAIPVPALCCIQEYFPFPRRGKR